MLHFDTIIYFLYLQSLTDWNSIERPGQRAKTREYLVSHLIAMC
jgi:hypothetical protein